MAKEWEKMDGKHYAYNPADDGEYILIRKLAPKEDPMPLSHIRGLGGRRAFQWVVTHYRNDRPENSDYYPTLGKAKQEAEHIHWYS